MLLLGLATMGFVASPATAVEIAPLRADRPPDFTADLVLSVDAEGHAAMGISISVPYQGLQWVRLAPPQPAERYAAGVELVVAFQPRRPGPLRGDVWERRLVAGSFRGTRPERGSLVERRTFALPPGQYGVTVRVRDINAGTQSQAQQRFVVPDYSRMPVGFSDLELGVCDSISGFHPLATRVFGTEARRLAARASLFDRRSGPWPRAYRFHYRILDEIGGRLVEGNMDTTVNHSAEPIVIRPPSTDLFVGRYVFEVELAEGRSRWRVERSFEVEESGPPVGPEFERLLEPLSYIASTEEIERLRRLPEDQHATGWEEFWRRRDPTPDTPRNEALIEFITRVRYAEQHFQGYGPGWRSDMGRIYIRYGPPDQIETRPATTDSPQLQIWHYESPFRRFVFGDREGFGRYTLMSPLGE